MLNPASETASHPLVGRLAAPSFVIPAGVAQNARFLAGKVDEVGLCLFESSACLTYGPQDIPPDLAHLPLRWHAHLPVDLPWPVRMGAAAHPAREAARMALRVLDKAAFLGLRYAVLHPPQGTPAGQRRLLAGFARHWYTKTTMPLLLENVGHCDVACLGETFPQEHNLGLCLDVGHLLGYAQKHLLRSGLPEQALLAHWSAPGQRDQHLPLTALTPSQRHVAVELMARLPGTTVHMAEIFTWKGVAASLPVLGQFHTEIALTSV